MNTSAALLRRLADAVPTIWIIVARTQGSVPRESGASMLVAATTSEGTIGGGHLELKAIEQARAMLKANTLTATQRHFPLGPALGQCCGGAVSVLFVPVVESMRDELLRLKKMEIEGGCFELACVVDTGETITAKIACTPWSIWIFGAGHVGKALVDVLATLPCQITWVDERDAEFPTRITDNVALLASPAPADEVRHIPSGAQVLVLTHSHALDLEICFALLKRTDLAYCGLIGSATKAATFRKRFAERGVPELASSRIICPIGQAQFNSKHPGVIAVGVAADLIDRHQLFSETTAEPGLSAQNLIYR
jgi:xanthine dehydrogenase accessory factor